MITVSLVMSIVFAEVAVSIAIRAVIVFNAAAVSLPVAGVISFAIVARRDPTRSLIRWPSPVSFVLLVVPANRIPITPTRTDSGAGLGGDNGNHSRWRRCANHDSDRNLASLARARTNSVATSRAPMTFFMWLEPPSTSYAQAPEAPESRAIRECKRNTWSCVQVSTLSHVGSTTPPAAPACLSEKEQRCGASGKWPRTSALTRAGE